MDAALANRIERTAERLAATALGLAVGYAASALLGASAANSFAYVEGAGVGAIAYLATGRVLARIAGRHVLPVTPFQLETLTSTPEPELLLTEVHAPTRIAPEGPLVLDDILEALGPDSRVVRLFDRSSMPTAAQMKQRIDAHLSGSESEVPQVDASQALHDALSELRRAMR